MFFEFQPFLATDLSGRWESYRVFFAPLNWRFRSGDRVEFNWRRNYEDRFRSLLPFVQSAATRFQLSELPIALDRGRCAPEFGRRR
jgi:hypothetical protein